MNKTPLIEMIAFFVRHIRMEKPSWRKEFLYHTQRIRSRHTREVGGIRKSYFSIETKEGSIINLELDQEELLWSLEKNGELEGFTVDRLIAHIKRHKHAPSDAHRIDPIMFEIFPQELIQERIANAPALIERIKPFRFKRSKNGSIQVKQIETQHLENRVLDKNLHYVVEDTDGRFFHLMFVPQLMDWRFIQEVDEQFLFVRKKS